MRPDGGGRKPLLGTEIEQTEEGGCSYASTAKISLISRSNP
jgi:hypothetical protein